MRASRADIWWTIIGGVLGVFVVFVIEMSIAQGLGYNQNDQFEDYPMYVSLVCFFWWLFCLVKVIINRFHDLNRSAWWLLGLFFFPFSIGLLIELLFIGGKKGSNAYGKYKGLDIIPTYDPEIDSDTQNKTKNFEQKKSDEKNGNLYNGYNTQNKKTFETTTYQKNINQKSENKNISNSNTSNTSVSSSKIKNNHSISTPQVYTKKPDLHKPSGNYNPYSLSGK